MTTLARCRLASGFDAGRAVAALNGTDAEQEALGNQGSDDRPPARQAAPGPAQKEDVPSTDEVNPAWAAKLSQPMSTPVEALLS